MPSIIFQTLLTIFSAYLLLWVFQLLVWPVSKKLFGELADGGWAVSRMFGLLLISLLAWNLSYLGVPINTNLGIIIFEILFFLASVLITKKEGLKFFIPKRESLRLIFLEEYLFFVGFVAICLVRAYLPNLDSLEKFMDYGFIVRYLNSPTLPAMDMWQAGMNINYYSFGHFWASVLVRILNASPEVGYNLVLGFIAGQSLSLAFILCYTLGKIFGHKGSTLGGVLGAMLVVFGGNSHTVWYILKNEGLKNYWYADATRFIHNTIHEFPSYSLVVSDLHGHLFDLPTTLLFLIIFYLLVTREVWWDKVVIGSLLAIMMMTNTWDIPIYGLFMVVLIIGKLIKNPKEIGKWIKIMVVVFGVMALMSVLWWLKFVPISSGVALVTLRSPLWQLAVLWSGALAINLLAWFMSSQKTNESLFVRSLIITSICLVIIPEFVYAKDIYPDHPRANTMFKLTYQACIMVGIIFGSLIGNITNSIKNKATLGKGLLFVVGVVIFGGLMIFPTVSFPTFYENFKTFRGLDGEAWLSTKYPEKYQAVKYLKQFKDGKNLVEAVGDSYTNFNVVSAYSGVPTIQGWRVHEWLWRGGYDSVSVREMQAREVYEGVDTEKTKDIIKKYYVGWVLVTEDEEGMYNINHPKLKSIGKVVWEMNESYLVRVE
jgi:uncharacterized membrane protein